MVNKNGKPVSESVDLYAGLPYFPYLDTRDLFGEVGPYGFMDGAPQQYLTRRDNRMAGELLPTYINWWQLKIIRDRCRQVCRNNEFAIAAINAHRNYVVGTGFSYIAQAIDDETPVELIKKTQQVIDLFCEHNRMAEVESEIVYRLHAEGEVFIRWFPSEDGLLRVRFIEPELIRPPADDTTPKSSFGIMCADEDIHQRVGYWVIEKPFINLTPTLVESERILHLRLNVESNSKRGLPTVYAVESNLRAAEDVLQSMISLAKARAKIAVIRKVEDSPPEAIEELTKRATDYTVTDPVQARSTSINHMGYGSILTTTGNVGYEFPSMNIGSGDLTETLASNLRAIAARFGISETMMTADASNNNYASSLVAEAPAVKTFARMQRMISQAVGERRTRPERSLIWQQISHAVNLGLLPKEALSKVSIQAKGPPLTARDYATESNMNQTYFTMGLKSPQTISAELGLNYEEEQRNIKKAKESAPQQTVDPELSKPEIPEPTKEQVEERCWNGFEPVPGKKPYSKGSCRKKEDKYDNINFKPPRGVVAAAKRGLDLRNKHARGGTAVGVARARDLSNGKQISPETAKRMHSYFARHEVDKKGAGWGEDSAGYIAWLLWGGDPGKSWASKLVRQMDAVEESAKSSYAKYAMEISRIHNYILKNKRLWYSGRGENGRSDKLYNAVLRYNELRADSKNFQMWTKASGVNPSSDGYDLVS